MKIQKLGNFIFLHGRTAFMQVLTNILKQGVEFEGLGDSVGPDRYSKLVDVCCFSLLATF